MPSEKHDALMCFLEELNPCRAVHGIYNRELTGLSSIVLGASTLKTKEWENDVILQFHKHFLYPISYALDSTWPRTSDQKYGAEEGFTAFPSANDELIRKSKICSFNKTKSILYWKACTEEPGSRKKRQFAL